MATTIKTSSPVLTISAEADGEYAIEFDGLGAGVNHVSVINDTADDVTISYMEEPESDTDYTEAIVLGKGREINIRLYGAVLYFSCDGAGNVVIVRA